ncbi:hypothetical protein NMG60_11002007 [Bertholletia excelsa]
MDLRSESSALESAEANEEINPESMTIADGNKIENNGSCGAEYGDDKLLADAKGKVAGVTESLSSPPLIGISPERSVGLSSPAKPKGYGLKKWRRIKREVSKDGSSCVEISKIMKRGLSTSMVNSSKTQGLASEMNQKNEISLSSTDAILKTLSASIDGFSTPGSNLDSKLAIKSIFAAETDSENSEDRSSKSSTAASVPKLRYEIPGKNKIRNFSGNNMVKSAQKVQQGKDQIESSKKPRGERVKIEKENSHSSMESDSQSSNFFSVQGMNSVRSNGRQSGGSMNYDEETSEEAQGDELHFGEESQIGNSKKNLGQFEDISKEDLAADLSWAAKEEKIDNHRSSLDQDLLVESILKLQSAQEELEKEIQKLREIGGEHISLFDGSADGSTFPSELASVDPKIYGTSPPDLLHSGGVAGTSSCFLGTEVENLKQNINILESKLEDANRLLKDKEAKAVGLEYTLMNNDSAKEATWSSIELQQKKHSEVEAELEGLFKQKIEAEIEYRVIRTLASDQAKKLNKLEYAENKSVTLKKPAEELKTNNYDDVVGTDQILKLKKKVFKVSSCLLLQLILLAVVFAVFSSPFSPHDAGVVPT